MYGVWCMGFGVCGVWLPTHINLCASSLDVRAARCRQQWSRKVKLPSVPHPPSDPKKEQNRACASGLRQARADKKSALTQEICGSTQVASPIAYPIARTRHLL